MGWIVGLDGAMLMTNDGGKKWIKQDSPTKENLYGIQVVGNRGYVVGNRGNCLISKDSGLTWKANRVTTKYWLRDLSFTDEKNGWIIGDHGTVFNTTDGGETLKMVCGTPVE
jgi:photosystem II stability/assembly factor-like uncharacterized protein